MHLPSTGSPAATEPTTATAEPAPTEPAPTEPAAAEPAAETTPEIKARTDLNTFRVPEEFYDLTSDRSERVNLIAAPGHQTEIESMRRKLLAFMQRTGDPFAEAFAHRDNKELVPAVLEKMKKEYNGRKN